MVLNRAMAQLVKSAPPASARRPATGARARARKAAPASAVREKSAARDKSLPALEKAATGIAGFDEITGGGLPKGRPSLLCGGAGCGKTLFGLHFLVRGALEFAEPGVFIAFEEREQDLVQNVASLGFDLNDLVERKLIALDHIHVERMEIEE